MKKSIRLFLGILSASLAFANLRAEIAIKDGQAIAFLGDSITEGGWQSPAGYVKLVVAGLATNGINIKPVPAGISGHKSDQMLARLHRDVLSKKPDWMTLSCGVNDVWHGEKGIPLVQYRTNIAAIVDQCEKAGVKVMLLTSTPIGENINNANNQKLAGYNDYLRSLAREKRLLLADLNADFQARLKDPPAGAKGNSLTTDGVHMNLAGNMVMARGVLRAFGLDEAQLLKAEEYWKALPIGWPLRVSHEVAPGKTLRGGKQLSLRQYMNLAARAAQKKISSEDYAQEIFVEALQAELQSGGKFQDVAAAIDAGKQAELQAAVNKRFSTRLDELLKN